MKLTDTQSTVLAAAAARADGTILPLPSHLRGSAIVKVCDALTAKGLAIQTGASETEMLVITDAGRHALGLAIEPAPSIETKLGAKESRDRQAPRANTKQAQLIGMLTTPDGASIEEIVAAFGWQPHTVRGAIAGALKKKLGLQVGSEAVESRGRVYRIVSGSAGCEEAIRIETQLPN